MAISLFRSNLSSWPHSSGLLKTAPLVTKQFIHLLIQLNLLLATYCQVSDLKGPVLIFKVV